MLSRYLKEYKILMNELDKYNPELLDKQRFLGISKSDMLDEELMQELSKDLPSIPHVFISSQNETGLVQLKDMLWRELNPTSEI